MAEPVALELDNRQMQYIARISHGKDSLKMLDVIVSRGLPLDRITTTDIWATATIRGEHPKMVTFKDRADEYIWQKYRIEVEHLCAMKNGEKVTYEKMFYHVPKRKEGRKEGRGNPRISDAAGNMVPDSTQNKSTNAARRVFLHKSGAGAKSSKSTIYGFPMSINRKGQWCTKLKTRFWKAPPRGAGEISWNTWALQQTNRNALPSLMSVNVRHLWNLVSKKICAACIVSMRAY